MQENYGGFYLVRDSTGYINERCFSSLEKEIFDSKDIGKCLSCGKEIIYKEWFEEPIIDAKELRIYVLKAKVNKTTHTSKLLQTND